MYRLKPEVFPNLKPFGGSGSSTLTQRSEWQECVDKMSIYLRLDMSDRNLPPINHCQYDDECVHVCGVCAFAFS